MHRSIHPWFFLTWISKIGIFERNKKNPFSKSSFLNIFEYFVGFPGRNWCTLQETNISHHGKRKIIDSQVPAGMGYAIVPRRVYLTSHLGWWLPMYTFTLRCQALDNIWWSLKMVKVSVTWRHVSSVFHGRWVFRTPILFGFRTAKTMCSTSCCVDFWWSFWNIPK